MDLEWHDFYTADTKQASSPSSSGPSELTQPEATPITPVNGDTSIRKSGLKSPLVSCPGIHLTVTPLHVSSTCKMNVFVHMKQKIEWKKANISTPTQKLTDVFRNEI